MKDLIQAHKKLIKTVKEQMGFSDYGMYWLAFLEGGLTCLLYTSPSPRDYAASRMPSSA